MICLNARREATLNVDLSIAMPGRQKRRLTA